MNTISKAELTALAAIVSFGIHIAQPANASEKSAQVTEHTLIAADTETKTKEIKTTTETKPEGKTDKTDKTEKIEKSEVKKSTKAAKGGEMSCGSGMKGKEGSCGK